MSWGLRRLCCDRWAHGFRLISRSDLKTASTPRDGDSGPRAENAVMGQQQGTSAEKWELRGHLVSLTG